MELSTRVSRLEEALSTLVEAVSDTQTALRQLAEAQRQTQAQVTQLVEAQARADARLGRLETAVTELAEAQRQTQAQVAELAEAQRQTQAQVAELAEAQRQTQTQVAELAEAQRQTQAQVTQLVEAQRRTEQQLGTLIAWQQGERGRRDGEQFERNLVRRGGRVFHGGWGGTTQEEPIRARLTALLQPTLHEDVQPDADPLLADVLWWKGEQVAVVEASLVVDEDDVNRAWRRAETVRHAGAPALAVVVGNVWAAGETRIWAESYRVEWYVGSDLSEGLIAFRRRPGPPSWSG